MLIQRGLRQSMTRLSVLRSIARGAIGGLLFGILFNYGRWECLMPAPNLKEVYKTREPDIPHEFLQNLPVPSPPISGDRKFILKPWQLHDQVANNSNAKFFMIFLVTSRVADAKLRFSTRLSWASVGEIEGKRFRVIFVAPAAVNAAQSKLLASENDIYGDILQTNVDFQEKTYETLMILSGHQWCIENIGSRSEYFVNVDRNAFPFLPNLYEYAMNFAKNPDLSSAIHCGSKIVDPLHKPRDPLSKYYVKRRVYSESYFPSYCDPSIVITPQSAMKDLYNTAMMTKIDSIPQGDVFVWGVLREKLRSGGKKNIIDAPKSIKNESLTPLWYLVDFSTYKASKDVERLWDNTKEHFTFLKDASVTGKKRRALLVDIPRSDAKKTPESDMKTFVYKWARVSVIRDKPKTS